MATIEELVRFENDNTALKFRASQYAADHLGEFLVDVLAMANARVAGQRLIVLGVDTGSGKRSLTGITLDTTKYGEQLLKLAHKYIEPAVDLQFSMVIVDDTSIGLIQINNCDDQPYLMQQDYSPELRTGDAWVRKGSHQVRMARAEFDAAYKARFAKPGFKGAIRIGFGDGVGEVLSLTVLKNVVLPSADAAHRIGAAIKAKEAANAILGHDDTGLGRLMHVKYFGADAPLEVRSVDTLRQNLAMVKNEYHSQDLHYLFEKQAHRVNLVLRNQGVESLRDVSVTLEIPNVDGLDIADRIYPPPPVSADPASRCSSADSYPSVEHGEQATRIYAGLGDVTQDTQVAVFLEPLRVLLSTKLAGRTIAVHYAIKARNLREAMTGRLQIAAAVA